MQRPHTFALLLASGALGSLALVACGGAVEPGNGGYGGGGTTSSSGVSSSSGGSSGVPGPSPECAGLPLPDIAGACPDGTSVGGYYVYDGKQCVLTFPCPPAPGPFPGVPGGSSSGYPGSSTGGSSGYTGSSSGYTGSSSGYYGGSSSGIVPPTPTPPVCNFALPNICEACSNGETICAHYAIQNGTCVVEICPPTYVQPAPPPYPVGSDCSQGAPCSQGTGCGTASSSPYGCSTSCKCDYTGYYSCQTTCTPEPSPPPNPYGGCSQGAMCSPGTGCGGGPDYYGCYESCTCDYYGTMQCTYGCPSYDAGFGGG